MKPKLRFPGYEEEWEEKKMGEIAERITKGTTPRDKNYNGEINFIKAECLEQNKINKSKLGKYLKRCMKLNCGDLF